MSLAITVFDIPNPYPLGVPERVLKEQADLTREVEALLPVFHIDAERMSPDDVLGTRRLLDGFLTDHHVDEDMIDALLNAVAKAACETDRLKWIDVAWGWELGWHVKVAREVDRAAS